MWMPGLCKPQNRKARSDTETKCAWTSLFEIMEKKWVLVVLIILKDALAISLVGARLRNDKLLPREFRTKVRMDQSL